MAANAIVLDTSSKHQAAPAGQNQATINTLKANGHEFPNICLPLPVHRDAFDQWDYQHGCRRGVSTSCPRFLDS